MSPPPDQKEQQTVPSDPEAHNVVRDLVVALVERRWRAAIEIGRRYLTRVLAGVVATGLLTVVAGFIWWPLIAAIVAGAVVVAALAFAVGAQRLMYGERRRRAWAEIAVLRERQRALRAEDILDAATIVLARGESPLPHLRGRNDLVSAIMRIRHQAAEARAAKHPQPPAAQQHRDAVPPPVETGPLERRRTLRARELQELDAAIQATAAPSESARERLGEARSARRAAERAAFAADREAGERVRRGLPPTAQPGTETTLQISLDARGGRDVKKVAEATPEEIARPPQITRPLDD